MFKKLIAILSGATAIATFASPVTACADSYSVGSYIKPLKDRDFGAVQDEPLYSYIPHTINTTDDKPNLNEWANDPYSIIWDESTKQYFSWELFRKGRSGATDLVEMTSKDLAHWKQGQIRIGLGKQFFANKYMSTPSALGGGVYLDKDGNFTGNPGDVIFLISMQQCDVMNYSEQLDNLTKQNRKYTQEEIANIQEHDAKRNVEQINGDAGIAYFVSHGLGKPIYNAGVLANVNPYLMAKTKEEEPNGSFFWGKDYRDTYLYTNKADPAHLYFAISCGNRLEFWRIDRDLRAGRSSYNKGLNDFTKKSVQASQKSGKPLSNGLITYLSNIIIFNDRIGVEVPNVEEIDSDRNLWLISMSIQGIPVKNNYASAWYYLCRWDSNKFEIIKSIKNNNSVGRFEYGEEAYSQRNSEIDVNGKTEIVSRSMPNSWVNDPYDNDIWSWRGGAYPTEHIVYDDNKVKILPLNFPLYNYDKNSGTAIFNLKASELEKGLDLKFNYGNFHFGIGTQYSVPDTDEYLYNKQKGSKWETPKQVITWNNEIDMGSRWSKWVTEGGQTDLSDDVEIIWNKCTLMIYNRTKGWVGHFMLPQGIELKNATDISPNVKSWNNKSEIVVDSSLFN